jgi:misacylated tRNA(Ala) deacylase
MTKKLYWEDAYVKEFDAGVVETGDKGLVLDQTAFYPTGGGQANDTGSISVDGRPYRITDVRKEGEVIYHVTDEKIECRSGTRVHGIIDWDRRYRLMRYHTFLHVMDAVIHKKYGGKITGGIIYPDRAHMDFDMPELNRELAVRIIEESNTIAAEGHAVSSRFLTNEEAQKIPELARTAPGGEIVKGLDRIRIVAIEDLDFQADGGTHVANTSEIGSMRLSDFKNKGTHRKRVEIMLL